MATTNKHILNVAVLTIMMSIAWLHEGYAAPPAFSASARRQECSDKPLSFMGFWGFGDFQGQQLKPEEAGLILHLTKITTRDWSGWSKEWKTDPLPLGGRDTLIVEVQGAASINYESAKMMKWFVQWPEQQSDVALKCPDSEKCSSEDPEWAVPVDGKFEYSLPKQAVQVDKLTKIGFTLLQRNTYDDVRVKAWFTCARTSTKKQ
jgi:hypothetical protein